MIVDMQQVCHGPVHKSMQSREVKSYCYLQAYCSASCLARDDCENVDLRMPAMWVSLDKRCWPRLRFCRARRAALRDQLDLRERCV